MEIYKYLEQDQDNLLFLGDYVDRGAFGIEIVLLLLTLKLSFPQRITLLRGNHETRNMTEMFNFREECIEKYDQEVYDIVMETFDRLPVAATVNGEYLCMHGGVSQIVTSLNSIDRIDRKREPPDEECLLNDLLWADPAKDDKFDTDAALNHVRGLSIFYGKNLVNKFLQSQGLKAIIRGHEVQHEGFKQHKWNGQDAPAPVITIFSAPNYCGTYANDGATLKALPGQGLEVEQFYEAEKTPFLLPEYPLADAFQFFMDDFCGSILEVMGKISQKAINCIDENASQLSKKESPLDQGYIQKLVEKSKVTKTKANLDKGPQQGQSDRVSDLLDQFEKELSLDNNEKEEPKEQQQMALQITDQDTIVKRYSFQEKKQFSLEIDQMLTRATSHALVAQRSQNLLAERRQVDKYVDVQAQKQVIDDIQKRFSEDIESATNYKQREKLYKKMSLEQYKAMIKLDRGNEMHPSKRREQKETVEKQKTKKSEKVRRYSPVRKQQTLTPVKTTVKRQQHAKNSQSVVESAANRKVTSNPSDALKKPIFKATRPSSASINKVTQPVPKGKKLSIVDQIVKQNQKQGKAIPTIKNMAGNQSVTIQPVSSPQRQRETKVEPRNSQTSSPQPQKKKQFAYSSTATPKVEEHEQRVTERKDQVKQATRPMSGSKALPKEQMARQKSLPFLREKIQSKEIVSVLQSSAKQSRYQTPGKKKQVSRTAFTSQTVTPIKSKPS